LKSIIDRFSYLDRSHHVAGEWWNSQTEASWNGVNWHDYWVKWFSCLGHAKLYVFHVSLSVKLVFCIMTPSHFSDMIVWIGIKIIALIHRGFSSLHINWTSSNSVWKGNMERPCLRYCKKHLFLASIIACCNILRLYTYSFAINRAVQISFANMSDIWFWHQRTTRWCRNHTCRKVKISPFDLLLIWNEYTQTTSLPRKDLKPIE